MLEYALRVKFTASQRGTQPEAAQRAYEQWLQIVFGLMPEAPPPTQRLLLPETAAFANALGLDPQQPVTLQ